MRQTGLQALSISAALGASVSLDVSWGKISPPLTDAEKEGWAFPIGCTLLACGMDRLRNTDDAVELYARCTMLDRMNGSPTLTDARGDDCNNLELWLRWVGVAVNSSRVPRTTWLARMANNKFADVQRVAQREAERLRAAQVAEAVTKVGEALNSGARD